jgi:tetratricopeptide (TPR) repeat protein
MSLPLDAHRKQQTQKEGGKHVTFELCPEDQPDSQPIKDIQEAEQNISDAKSPGSSFSRTHINRKLLLGLCVLILLGVFGAGEYRSIDFLSSVTPPNSKMSVPAPRLPLPAKMPGSVVQQIAVVKNFTAEPIGILSTLPLIATGALADKGASPVSVIRENNPVQIEKQRSGLVDPLHNKAYLAYRGANLDEAQQLYRKILESDANNLDALLGLAVIAQQQGEEALASQYYSKVLALAPDNMLANVGISSLIADHEGEKRLKILLDNHKDSAFLHFALGNRYAEQSRWEAAQQAYFEAFALEPGNAEFAFNLAISLDHLGQGKLAAQYYRRALQLDQAGENPDSGQKFNRAQIERRIVEFDSDSR